MAAMNPARIGHRSGTGLAVLLLCVSACVTQQGAAQDASPEKAPNFTLTYSRVAVDPPAQPLSLGEENELTLRVRGGELVKVWATQDQDRGRQEQETPVSRRADGTLSIRVVPMALGDIKLLLMAQFSDGSFDQSIVTLKVGMSKKPPAWIAIAPDSSPDSDGDYVYASTDDPSLALEGGRYSFSFQAYYYGVKQLISLDPAWIRFRVIQPTPPVIDVDSAGAIKPLRKGDALLELSFAGAVRRTCVVVRQMQDRSLRGTCKQLRLALLKPTPQPLSNTWSTDPDGLQNERFYAGIEFYTDRLKVTPPNQPVEYGQPITFPVEITSGGLESLGFAQRRSDMDDPNLQTNKMAGHPGVLVAEEVKINGAEASSPKSMEIVPMTVGDETVQVYARFEDGGFAQRYFRMHVLSSTKGLRRLDVVDRLTERGRQLRPYLKYEQFGGQVEFSTMSGFTISVEQPKDAPVVRIDPDGWVHEIRPGRAVVTVSLGAISGKTLLQVTPPLNRVYTRISP
jgi:hypothetical protein